MVPRDRQPADEDEALLDRLARGNAEALETIFRRHADFVYRVALGLTGSVAAAEDVVQEVFLALAGRPDPLRLRQARLSTWLYRVARNRAIDGLRREGRRRGLTPTAEASGPPEPDAALLGRERGRELHRALGALPPRAREVFVLRVGLGLSVGETAKHVGIRPGAVRSALHDASRRLREAIGEPERQGRNHERRLAASGD